MPALEKIQHFLEQLGLNHTDIQIFLWCLHYPNSAISSLSRITNLPRSTVNDSINRLVQQWYILKQEYGKWSLYSSLSYEGIKSRLTQQQLALSKKAEHLETIKTEFEKIAIDDQSLSRINHYTWRNAMSIIYTKLAQSSSLRAIYNPEISVSYSNYTTKDLADLLITNTIDSREILISSPLATDYASHFHNTKKHQTVLIDHSMLPSFDADRLITDDAFYFISFWPQIVAIEITNTSFLHAQKAIFDQLRTLYSNTDWSLWASGL